VLVTIVPDGILNHHLTEVRSASISDDNPIDHIIHSFILWIYIAPLPEIYQGVLSAQPLHWLNLKDGILTIWLLHQGENIQQQQCQMTFSMMNNRCHSKFGNWYLIAFSQIISKRWWQLQYWYGSPRKYWSSEPHRVGNLKPQKQGHNADTVYYTIPPTASLCD
jgi:hypothetical protein